MVHRGFFNWGGENIEVSERKSFHIMHILPITMVAYFTYRAVTPWSIKKTWFLFLMKVICAPIYPVDFQASYVGDLLTSLVRVLISMAYSFIYFLLVPIGILFTFDVPVQGADNSVHGADTHFEKLSGFQYVRQSLSWWRTSSVVQVIIIPILTLAPLLLRLFQCLRRSVETGHRWPHIANAAKYTSAIIVVATGTLIPSVKDSWLWIASFVGATCYQFIWDITMDWG